MIPSLVSFDVFGKAEPAGSKKAVPQGERWGVVDANANAKDWKRTVAQVAAEHQAELLEGPLAVELIFYVPRPKGHYGTGRNAGTVRPSAPAHPTTRPDVLKLARGVEDALTGVIWRDDAQIVDERLVKRYGAPARCEIRIFRPAAIGLLGVAA